jgi:hypothetical protein
MTSPDLEIPRPGHAYWSAFQPPEGDTRPIDPLGFSMYADRLGNCLLPGITGRTTRVRYLGMVCAGLLVTEHAASAAGGRIARARRDAFLPFERAWALAVCENAGGDGLKEERAGGSRGLKPEYSNFRGANNVLRYWRECNTAGLSRVNPSDYTLLRGQAAQGGLGAYMVTLDSAGFVDRRSLSLRESGRQLADAFIDDERKRMKYLHASTDVHRGMLGSLGGAFSVAAPSQAEAAMVRKELFSPESGSLARAVRGLGTVPTDAEVAVKRLANSTKELANVATYALAFDPVRQACLAAFGSLGKELAAAGSLPANALPDETAAHAEGAMSMAGRLADLPAPDGLQPLQGFAMRLVACKRGPAVMDLLLDWHQQHRAAWISRDGTRFVLGRRANFDFPLGFHGYTVPSYFDLLADLDAAEHAGTAK